MGTASGQVTMNEAGRPGVEISGRIGLFAPAGTPAAIVQRLTAEAIEGLRDPAIAESLPMAGTLGMTSSPEVAAEFVRKEQASWRGIAGETGIKPKSVSARCPDAPPPAG